MDVLLPCLDGFLTVLGVALGDWTRITGFLRKERDYQPALAYGFIVALFLGLVFYSRNALLAAAPTTYLYLEVGGSLLSFCYAANALVRFRGTHDRTSFILAFGFVLSGMIETAGYFNLNDLIRGGHVALSHVPMGWMVGRTLLAVLLLVVAVWAVTSGILHP